MNFEWRPPDSPQPSLNVRCQIPKSTSRNKIPIGTVATRVRTIQSLKTKLPTPIAHSQGSIIKAQRGKYQVSNPLVISKRGLTSRCMPSASRSATPGPHPDIDTAHSFLGYRTPRTNHEEEHTSFTAARESGGASKGLTENILAKGVVNTESSNALDGWRTSELAASSSKSGGPPNMNSTDELTRKELCFCSRNVAVSPEQRGSDIHHQDKMRNDSSSEASISRGSVATTSTMRRQSVRELFRDHGIQRPAGFASAISCSDEVPAMVNIAQAEVCCHLCSFTNKHIQITCMQCGHPFCAACTAVGKDMCSDNCRAQVDATISNTPSHPSNVTEAEQLHSPERLCLSDVEMLVEQRQSLCTSSQSSGAESGVANCSKSNSMRSEPCDQDPPAKIEGQMQSSDKKTVTPTSKRRSISLNQCHEKCPTVGSSVDRTASFHDDQNVTEKSQTNPALIAPNRWWRTSSHPYFSPPHSRESQTMTISAETSTPLTVSESVEEAEMKVEFYVDPAYVECHGYPRTGHDRYGSPVGAGIVGDCQHCIDDCECVACQSTPHAVRCCTNKAHPSIPHVHQASPIRSKRSASISLSSGGMDRISPLSTTPAVPDVAKSNGRIFSRKTTNANKGTAGVSELVASNVSQTVLPPTLLCGSISTKLVGANVIDMELERSQPAIRSNRRNAISIEGSKRKKRRQQGERLRDKCNFPTSEIQAQTGAFGDLNSSIRNLSQPLSIKFDHVEKPRFKKVVPLETLKEQLKQRETRKAKLQQGMKNLPLPPQVAAVEEPDIHSDQQFTGPEQGSVNRKLRPAQQQLSNAISCSDMSDGLAKEQQKPSGHQPSDVSQGGIEQRSMKSAVSRIQNEEVSSAYNSNDIVAKNKTELPGQEEVSHFHTTSKNADILGITVIVHMSNRDDLVFRVDAALANK